MPSSPTKKHRDDSEARRSMQLTTWIALAAGALGVLLIWMPRLLPFGGPWVQLGLGLLTLFLSFRARAIGTRGVDGYDGRLSLLSAIAGFVIVFFAGNQAFGVLMSLGS